MFFYIETNYLPYIIRPDQNLDLFDVLQLGNRTNRKKGFSFYTSAQPRLSDIPEGSESQLSSRNVSKLSSSQAQSMMTLASDR